MQMNDEAEGAGRLLGEWSQSHFGCDLGTTKEGSDSP